MERINFLGYPVDNIDITDALKWMEQRIKNRTPSSIAVLNANKLWLMSRNERLADFVGKSDLVIPEWAVYWGSSILGKPLKSSVYGVVLLKEALGWAEREGFRPFFLGGKQEMMDDLLDRLSLEHPKLSIAGGHNGYIRSPEENDQVIRFIQECHADILFVGMGSPKQEFWIQENQTNLRVPVTMGVGGSFDVIAGLKKDTPNWARGHGVEWLYRLGQDPKAYWNRYLITNPWFIYQVFKAKVNHQS